MNTEQRIYTLLKKVEETQKSKVAKFSKLKKAIESNSILSTKLAELKNAKKPIVAKKPRIKLGKVDELDYDYATVEEEFSKLSYFVDEAYNEYFDQAVQSWQVLNDVFKNNSENFWRFEDELAGDKIKLEEIQALADQLGVDVSEVYPDFEEHYNIITQGMTLDAVYDEKEREFYNYFG
jgi:cell fate (sporulation/competence/biofilm development) regulator YmcA (YheA/YmcA/DUF963 family)